MPLPEILIWDRIRNKQIGYKFRRQYSIKNFIVDFYCPQKKLAIEIDGENHFKPKVKEKDIWRQNIIEEFGIKFIRFSNKDVLENIDSVLQKIVYYLNLL